MPRDEIEARVAEALRMVQLEAFAGRSPGQLSGGQRQRVGLARAIVNRPSLLLLDEPLGALDLKLRQDMQLELKHIQEKLGITFLYVTHDQDEALSMSDRIAVFNDGRIEQVGPPERRLRAAGERVRRRLRRHLVDPRARRPAAGAAAREGPRRAAGRRRFDRSGWHVEAGGLEDFVYGGMFTRYLVRLDAGESRDRRRAEPSKARASGCGRCRGRSRDRWPCGRTSVFSLGEAARTQRMENRT